MVNLLIKNGVGTDENRSLFKNARGSLNEVEQRTLATALGLQIVSNEVEDILVQEPRLNTYKVLVEVPIEVEAYSEAEARELWFDEATSDSFEADDVKVTSVVLVPSEDSDEDEEDIEEDPEQF